MRCILFALASGLAVACGGGGGETTSTATSPFTVSGEITGVTGVTVSLAGPLSKTTTTDALGAFRFEGLAAAAYTLTPSLSGYVFSPASRTVTVSGADVAGQNFSSAPVRSDLSISGTVAGGGGATVSISPTATGTALVTTDGGGRYSFTGLGPGSYTVTPSKDGFSFKPAATTATLFDESMAGLNFSTVRDEVVDAQLSTPAARHIATVPVIIIRYLPTNDGVNLDTDKATDYWGVGEITLAELERNIDAYNVWGKFMLEEGSRFQGYKDPSALPYLGYQVLKAWTVYDQVPRSSRFTASSIDGHPVAYPDFFRIASDFDLKRWVEAMGVKEVWIWYGQSAMPGWPSYRADVNLPEYWVEFIESNMASPTSGDMSNSYRAPDDLPIYASTYVVYCHNFRRSQAEMVHNHGHQFESIYKYVAARQDGDSNLFVRDFSGWGADYSSPPLGRAGDTHHPPNTSVDYDYLNMTLVESDIEDWRPVGGAKKLVNADTWRSIPYAWPSTSIAMPQVAESKWYVYWMQNMPGYGNTIPYGSTTMTNWWELTADWDSAVRAGTGLHH